MAAAAGHGTDGARGGVVTFDWPKRHRGEVKGRPGVEERRGDISTPCLISTLQCVCVCVCVCD